MTTWKWILLLALAGYAGLLALLFFAQRSLMYFPDRTRTPPAAAGFLQAEEQVLATSDGERVIVWHSAPRDGMPVIVYFHGNGGALNLRANRFRTLAGRGFGIVALSYRGYGGSSGSPSEEGILRDADATYAFAAERYGSQRLVLWGESLGTGVAAALAAEKPVARVLLESPYVSAAAIAASAYPFVPVRLLMKDQFRTDLRVPRITVPILVMHGVRDGVVPFAHGEQVFALANESKVFVRLDAAGHNDHDSHGGIERVAGFLEGREVGRAP